MYRQAAKLFLKTLVWVLALCGFVLSITGVVELHQESCDGSSQNTRLCDLHGYQWWVLAFEAFVLVLLGVMEGLDFAGDVYVALTGLLLFACMEIERAGWLTWNNANQWTQERNLAGAGFATLFCVNLLMAVNLGLERFAPPVVPPAWKIQHREFRVFIRFVGLVLAGLGITGLAMVAKQVDDNCNVACEDNWWFLAQHLFAFVLFIVTEVVFEVLGFRPVLTILLSLQIRRFELSADGTDELLGKVGLLLTIISAYLLILLCMHSHMGSHSKTNSSQSTEAAAPAPTAGPPPSPSTSHPLSPSPSASPSTSASGSGTPWILVTASTPGTPSPLKETKLLLGVLPVLGVLVGLIVAYVNLDFAKLSSASRWIFASQIMTLIFGIMSLIPGKSILDNLRLPLVALMSMAIYQSPSWIDAWRTNSESVELEFGWNIKNTGIGNLILAISFLPFMMVVGVDWKGLATRERVPAKNLLISKYPV